MKYFMTVAQAQARIPETPDEIIFVKATGGLYYYESAGSAYTADSNLYLTTGNGGNTRWLIIDRAALKTYNDTLYSTITVESITAVSFLNSWVNYNSGVAPVGYYKDPYSRVHLTGVASSGTVGAAIFTLPSGYRPPYPIYLIVRSNELNGLLTIATNGNVTLSSGSNVYVSLQNISFRI